jgi:hypothetical protein
MRVKRRNSRFEAQCALEDHLRKTVVFHRMVVRECREEPDFGSIFGGAPAGFDSTFGDIFKGFNDIFGRKK